MLLLIKKLTLLLILLFSSITLFAQQITFEATAPNIVAVGEVFRVEYTVSADIEIDKFTFTRPIITDFDVIAGPTESKGQSVSIINGDVSKSVNITYTYVLSGQKKGLLTVPSTKMTVNGVEYTSKRLNIEVIGDDKKSDTTKKITPEDIIVKVTTNKSEVYKGEPIKVSIKLYSQVILSIENSKFPSFNGFYVQEIDNSNARQHRATLDSKVYNAITLREYLLFPQQSGVLEIEQTDINVIAQIVTQTARQSTLDNFFGNDMDVMEIRRKISAAPLKITVKELPNGAPASFNGAVGDFTIKKEIPTSEVAANSSVTYSLEINGVGNLPLLQTPKLDLPNSFEQYSVKTTESLKILNSNISGYRRFEYPIIARAEGQYDIQPVSFTFFNPNSSKYVTVKTESSSINVLPDSSKVASIGSGGLVSGLSKEEVKILGEDIRFIRIGESNLDNNHSLFMFSIGYFISILLVIGTFVFALVYLQKRIKDMKNKVLVRGKRANKVALQRLNIANQHIKQDDKRKFYEEMLKALWGYMSDKLNIPVSNLTKDNVREGLLKKSVSIEDVNVFLKIISDCEYAQYSPVTTGHMNEIYNSAVAKISKFESTIK